MCFGVIKLHQFYVICLHTEEHTFANINIFVRKVENIFRVCFELCEGLLADQYYVTPIDFF